MTSSLFRQLFIAYGLALTLAGCAKPKETLIVPGKTTQAEADRLMGPPKATMVPPSRPQAQLVDYLTPGNTRVQFEQKVSVAVYRDPEAREATLQYWRHEWKGKDQRFVEIPESRDAHGQGLYQLVAPDLKMAVVYNPASDRVIRVVNYAGK